ncbi:MAG: ATP-binding protein [Candidatus Competibacteraceae bacterium]|nr:ATP-binding protein [Candidatus Competibacteraceae bacterium]
MPNWPRLRWPRFSAAQPKCSTGGFLLPVLEPLPLVRISYGQCVTASTALTVVTGPPGTGKSQVAVALMASAALAGRSVLFASRNHQAIDAVVDRFAEVVERHPLLIRANTRDGGRIQL